jgi:MFS family permease
MGPAALAIIWTSFPRGQRATVLGVWAGVSSAALALGPLTGAVLTQQLGWSWIFWVNVPLGIIAWLVGRHVLSGVGKGRAAAGRIDALGLVLAAGAVVLAVFALTEGASYGWRSPVIAASLLAGVLLAGSFLVRERRSPHGMIDLSLFSDRSFTGANVVTLLSTAVMCSIFFFVSLYLQMVRGYSPIEAGATFLPMTVLIVVGSPLSGRLCDRVGARLPVTIGLVILATGLGVLSWLGTSSSVVVTLSGLAVVGVGVALITTPAAAAALDGAVEEQQAMAAGILNTFRVFGLAVGIAAMGAIVALHWPGGFAQPNGLSDGFVSGLSHAFRINTGIALVTAVIAFRTLATGSRATGTAMADSQSKPVPMVPAPSPRGFGAPR